MSDQLTVIAAIKTDCTSLFTTIIENDVSEESILAPQLPCLVISQIDTVFVSKVDKQVQETYNVKLLIMLQDNTATVLTDLLAKQKAVISAFLAKYSAMRKACVTDGIELKDSSASNTVKQNRYGSAVVCILNLTCRVVNEY